MVPESVVAEQRLCTLCPRIMLTEKCIKKKTPRLIAVATNTEDKSTKGQKRQKDQTLNAIENKEEKWVGKWIDRCKHSS